MTADTTTERRVTQAQIERLTDWSMRKPVIALMGEFSSGKSTLMNLLIGQDVLPTQVTATRMPPVWLTYGDAPPCRIDHDGRTHKVDFNKPNSIPIHRTRFVRLYVKADILKRCDLIDTPGISDPNIKTEDWIRTIRYANAVMWCTHAGQAWRESERGAWESLPTRLRETSILLVTRKDKISSERDLAKIRRRLERETQHLFNSRMFVSLTNAVKARDSGNAEAWAESGAEDFVDMLEKIVEGIYVQRSFLLSRYVTSYGNDAVASQSTHDTATDAASEIRLGGVETADPDTRPEPALTVEMQEEAAGHGGRNDLGMSVEADAPQAVDVDSPDSAVPASDVKEAAFNPTHETVDLNSYRLNDPSAYREAPERRVGLANYRLEDPSLRDASAQENSAQSAFVSTPVLSSSGRDNTSGVPAIQSEVELIEDMWVRICEQYDTSKTPSLVVAVEQLIAGLNQKTA